VHEQKETIKQLTDEAILNKAEIKSLMKNISDLEDTVIRHKNKNNEEENVKNKLTSKLHETQGQLESYIFKYQDMEKLMLEHESLFLLYSKTHKGFAVQISELKKTNDILSNELNKINEENDAILNKYHNINEGFTALIKTLINGSSPDNASISAGFLSRIRGHSKYIYSEEMQSNTIRQSGLFEESWYLSEYPDVAKASLDPILHYIRHGAKELRNPSNKFNTLEYLKSNPSLVVSKFNPLVHYIENAKPNNI
jgi:hypothetical protein